MKNRQTGAAMAKRVLCALLCAVTLLGCLVVPAEAAASQRVTLRYYSDDGPGGMYWTQTVTAGRRVTMMEYLPYESGYKVEGWYRDQKLTKLAGRPGDKYTATKNEVFYPKLAKTNLAAVAYEDEDVYDLSGYGWQWAKKGSVITLKTPPSRPGYRFVGWYREWYVGGVLKTLAGKAGDQFKVPSEAKVWLYPKWQAVSTVKYNSNGGSAIGNRTVDKNSTITLPTPTRSGYTFVGWYTDSGLKNLAGKGGASYKVTGNVTLYAKWGTTATVVYEINPRGGAAASMITVAKGSTIKLPTMNDQMLSWYASGRQFLGWYKDPNFKTLAGKGGANYKVTGNVTLYAKWSK